MLIDARGLSCPKLIMMAEEALLKIDEGFRTHINLIKTSLESRSPFLVSLR